MNQTLASNPATPVSVPAGIPATQASTPAGAPGNMAPEPAETPAHTGWPGPHLDLSPYRRHFKASPVMEKYFPASLTLAPELWPRQEMEAYQTEAVADMLRHARENNPFYCKQFTDAGLGPGDFRNLDDLQRFPFLHKDELKGQPWKLLSVERDQISQIHVSTGTTSTREGDHIYSIFSWEDLYLDELAINMPLQVPTFQGEVVMIALPYEMSSAGMAFHRYFQHGCRCAVVNAGKGGFYSDPHKTLLMLKDLEAAVLVTTPSWAMHLAHTAWKQGMIMESSFHPRLLWLTGEGCSDAYRTRLEKLWGCPALRYYGSLECGPLGTECREKDGYHLPEGHVWMEIIDPDTGEVLPEGSVGEICVTVLYRRAMPLIRYRTQDLGYLDSSPCPCGNQFRRLYLRGRSQDELDFGGQTVSPTRLEEILYRLPEAGNSHQFRTSRDPDGKIHLTAVVELPWGTTASPEAEEIIRTSLETLAGEVEAVHLVKEISQSRGKTQRLVHQAANQSEDSQARSLETLTCPQGVSRDH